MRGAEWAWLALGAAIASPVRYWVGVWGRPTDRRPFPLGTFTVNAAACLLLGVALEMRTPQPWIQALVSVGVCGALSTWSTLAWETTGLVRARRIRLAAAYLGSTVTAGVLLAWAGNAVGRLLW
ncbi:CrcB family protein [Streptomyces sp. VRA16 Mangrove soil]|uniref:fluoride efflux transporter FluC n=1 Tax=Streptomyces sp. VRA16 Mangrove soil TaxID=2817434 RepID=UPI001A9DBABA|nr:CrcB family protein [Streptomyces sp. VRA16 Mangrove soil]MBO1335714.1 CrcB family protein [Streptomyces sp. VRA16 Mangrove soil]